MNSDEICDSIVRIEYERDEASNGPGYGLTVWFEDSAQPWSIREFEVGSPTRLLLEGLQASIEDYLMLGSTSDAGALVDVMIVGNEEASDEQSETAASDLQ